MQLTIRNRIETVQTKIEQICNRTGRNTSEITFIGVTKGHGIEQVNEALESGITDLGAVSYTHLTLPTKA